MNKLPQELLNKIQLFLRHPCAEMLEKEIQWHLSIVHDDWKRAILEDYRDEHSHSKFECNYNQVVMQFMEKKEWIRSRDYHRRYFDYETLLHNLRVNMRGRASCYTDGVFDDVEC